MKQLNVQAGVKITRKISIESENRLRNYINIYYNCGWFAWLSAITEFDIFTLRVYQWRFYRSLKKINFHSETQYTAGSAIGHFKCLKISYAT